MSAFVLWMSAAPLSARAAGETSATQLQLDVRSAELAGNLAEDAYERKRALFAAGLASASELREAEIGRADARDVVLDASYPLNLTGRVSPAVIKLLRAHEKQSATIFLRAAADAIPGEYSLKLQARTKDRLADLESPEQTFRISLTRERSLLLTVLFGVVATAAIALLTRRYLRTTRSVA